jgi:zinc D-Ala-D-Ala carboxypeptidase
MQLSDHFSLAEFTRSDTAVENGIVNTPLPEHLANLRHLAAGMERVRSLFNAKIKITSGYRNPELNEFVKGSKTSAHCFGHAADFHVEGLSDLDAAKRIRDSDLEFDQLIFEKDRCVHISFDPDGNGTGKPRRQVLRQPDGPRSPVFVGLEP